MTQDLSKEPVNAVVEADLDTMTATKETLEDYTLRFAPRSYRKWSTRVVGISALGGIAYLADFAIGANIGISYGTTNALFGILIFAVVIFLTGFRWPTIRRATTSTSTWSPAAAVSVTTARWSPTSSSRRSRSSSLRS